VSLYRIKLPLEWRHVGKDIWRADHAFGFLEVAFDFRRYDPDSPPVKWKVITGASVDGEFETREEAQTAAEDKFRSRLLEALEPATEQDTRGTE
jgi:hypothetical protein